MSLFILHEPQSEQYVQMLQKYAFNQTMNSNTDNPDSLESRVNANTISCDKPIELDSSGFCSQYPSEKKLFLFAPEQLHAELQSPYMQGICDGNTTEWDQFCKDIKQYVTYLNTKSPHPIIGNAEVSITSYDDDTKNGYTITIDFSDDESIAQVIEARKSVIDFAKNPLRFVGASSSEIVSWLSGIAKVNNDYAPLSEIQGAKHRISFQRQQYADISADGVVRTLYFYINKRYVGINVTENDSTSDFVSNSRSHITHHDIDVYPISSWRMVQQILNSPEVQINYAKIEELQEQEINKFLGERVANYPALSPFDRIKKLSEFNDEIPRSLKALLKMTPDSIGTFIVAAEGIDGIGKLQDYLYSKSCTYQLLIENAVLPNKK